VILSGMLNDGASGMSAIKACGGTAIVQHPIDAVADQMTLAALEAVDADEVASANELAQVIARVVRMDTGPLIDCPDSLALEVEIAAGARLGAETLSEIADPSPLSCPDCHGVLSEVRGQRPLRYRCQIGHALTAEVLDARRLEIDDALRIALRVMEERVTLVTRMARDARDTGRTAVAELYEARAVEYQRYALVLREAAVDSIRDVPQRPPEER
jgi:two-component system chemotaxis response regulator CheB